MKGVWVKSLVFELRFICWRFVLINVYIPLRAGYVKDIFYIFGALDDLFKYILNFCRAAGGGYNAFVVRSDFISVREFAVRGRRISFHADAGRGALCPGHLSHGAPLPSQRDSTWKNNLTITRILPSRPPNKGVVVQEMYRGETSKTVLKKTNTLEENICVKTEEKRGGRRLQRFEHATAARFPSTFSDHFKVCLYIFMVPSFVGGHIQWDEGDSAVRGGRTVMAACKALSECGDKDCSPDGRPFTTVPSTAPQTGLHIGATRTHRPRLLTRWAGILPAWRDFYCCCRCELEARGDNCAEIAHGVGEVCHFFTHCRLFGLIYFAVKLCF